MRARQLRIPPPRNPSHRSNLYKIYFLYNLCYYPSRLGWLVASGTPVLCPGHDSSAHSRPSGAHELTVWTQ
jgi:hypothetical protein